MSGTYAYLLSCPVYLKYQVSMYVEDTNHYTLLSQHASIFFIALQDQASSVNTTRLAAPYIPTTFLHLDPLHPPPTVTPRADSHSGRIGARDQVEGLCEVSRSRRVEPGRQ